MESYGNVPANGLVVVDDKDAIMIDTPWTNEPTELLVNFLQNSLGINLQGIIATHWHKDCMGGLEYLHSIGVSSYLNTITQKLAGDAQLPVPQIGFDDFLIVKLNKKNLDCRYFGGGHTIDNIVVWIPHEKALFAGCMGKSLRSRKLGFTKEAEMEQWPKTLEKVLKAFPDCETVVPGHGNSGNSDLIFHTINLLKQNKKATLN